MLNRSNLYTYQERAASFIKDREAAALFVDCGLGKTISTLTAFRDLADSFDARRALVVAPLRVARKVWADEIKLWSHTQGIQTASITGDVPTRMAALRTPADLHTINRENLQWLHAQFLDNKKLRMRWPWDLVILDESSSFKSESSKRWQAMRDLRTYARRVVALTGTPIPNGYHDLYGQFSLLDRGARLGHTQTAFEDRWFNRPQKGDHFSKPVLKGDYCRLEIQQAISDITLSLRAQDHLDLPPVIYNLIRVQLSHAAMQTYKRMARTFITEVQGKTLTAVNAGVLDGKLLQLANGVVYVGDDKQVVEFHDEKLEALAELLESIPGKLLIAYYYKHDLERIKKILRKTDRKWELLRTDKQFDAWAAGAYDVGLVHPASCGHGLNDVYKSGCKDIVHFGCTANLELYQQVNARLTGGHRLQAGTRVHPIVAEGTRDDDYVELLTSKAVDQDALSVSLARRVSAV